MRASPARTVRAAAILILTALSACDNVEWGGAEVRVVQPPPPEGTTGEVAAPEEGATLGLPRGSVVFHVVRGQGGDRIIPVAEVATDSLRPLQRPAGVSPEAYEQRFRGAVLPPNGQYVLFRGGAPVGTFTQTGNGGLTACGVPTAVGQATTVAAAAADQEFIAFRKGLEPEVIGEYVPQQVDPRIRRYASIVAERIVLQNGLQRPRSWPGAQKDLQALDVVRGGTPEMATTYMVGDNLGMGAADPGGWSVFYLASYEQRTGYTPVYTEVRDYRKTGKAAPKVIGFLNLNGRGGNEVLVQIFGRGEAWYEAISADRGGRWQRIWEGQPCREQRPAE
ncbi:MAG TPA: hypothetical protein VHG91_10150 [Longimicrobium sp.]|nr:hypothetical protein [Longimicrobium sp.]